MNERNKEAEKSPTPPLLTERLLKIIYPFYYPFPMATVKMGNSTLSLRPMDLNIEAIPETFQPFSLVIPLQKTIVDEGRVVSTSPGEPLSSQPKTETIPLIALTFSQLAACLNQKSFPFHLWKDLRQRADNYSKELSSSGQTEPTTGLKKGLPREKAPFVYLTLNAPKGEPITVKCVILGINVPQDLPVNLNSAKMSDKLFKALGYKLEEPLPDKIRIEVVGIKAPSLPLDLSVYV